MLGGRSLVGKREFLARGFLWSGASFLLSHLPARDSLLVVNYHRIGNPDDDLFDPGIFSATAEEFSAQIDHLKRYLSPVTLEEALAFASGACENGTRRCRVLITLDDGYLDNYSIAYPILRSHGLQGVFFLTTGLVGSSKLPWWDTIAYLVKTARKRVFILRYPAALAVDIDRNGVRESLRDILKLYKTSENADPERFISELAEEAQGHELPETQRRFLNWDEAREMIRGGMAIGSHTRGHHVLSQLKPQTQFEELLSSRTILKEQLGVDPYVVAYPVGGKATFTRETQMLAREAGYRAAFSFHGGMNLPGKTNPFDVKRSVIVGQSLNRFRVQTAVCRTTGAFWP
jgi:peptidoglycan/xylan/chitin deacetylase (PgdA/CDA1 family)